MEFSELKNIFLLPQVSMKKILNLLSQLTTVKDNNGKTISEKNYFKFLQNLPDNVHIYTMCKDNELVGMGTLMIEPKLIHGGGYVGHIEDIVVDDKFRGNGYGKTLIDFLVNECKNFHCYKILLNCNKKNEKFYEKCGFTSKNIEMSLYL